MHLIQYPVFFLQSIFSSHGLQVILSVVELPAYIYAVISRLKKIIICDVLQQSIISISFLVLSCLDVADWLVGKEACLLPVTHLHWSCSHCIGFHWGFFLTSNKVMQFMKHFHTQRISYSRIFQSPFWLALYFRTSPSRTAWSMLRRTQFLPVLELFSFTLQSFSQPVSGGWKRGNSLFFNASNGRNMINLEESFHNSHLAGVQGLDCAHSWQGKTFSWLWFQDGSLFLIYFPLQFQLTFTARWVLRKIQFI